MKFTLYSKTIRSKRERVSSLGMEPLMARISNDATKRATVEALREDLPTLLPSSRWRYMEQLPRICPGLELQKRRGSGFKTHYNGVALLEIDDLVTPEEVQNVKQRVAAWPMTLAALAGASGRSVKVLVRGALPDGTLPTEEPFITLFHKRLYEASAKAYATFTGHALRSKAGSPADVFRWTWDPAPYLAPDAAPIIISREELTSRADSDEAPTPEYGPATVVPGQDTRRLYAMRFALAVRQMRETIEGARAREDDSRESSAPTSATLSDGEATLSYEDQLTLIGENCAQLGIPVEEAVEQSHWWVHCHIESRERGRTLIERAYLSQPRNPLPTRYSMQELTMELQTFMNAHYDLRFNELTNGVEWRRNHSSSFVFQPLDTRVMNTMIQEAHEHGIEVFDRDMKRFLGSTRIRNYNAASAYLHHVRNRWDGQTDYIGALADRVPNSNPHWREWFHTWFLGMVAQWEGFNPSHGNAVVPLLIGQQGCGKSTFGQLLLPPELRGLGYRELVDFSSKLEVERMLTTSLLINLDEFNQISETVQQGFLKNLLQKSSVKGRRPYSSVTQEMPRLASFIATSNMTDVLSDPSGSRRFIVAEISEGTSIDTSGGIPYDNIYGQAIKEIYNDLHRRYFTPAEVLAIEAHNARYANQRPEVSRFLEVFEPAASGSEGVQWLSVSELAAEVRRHTRFEYSNRGMNYLGRWLTAEVRQLHLQKKVSHGYAVYSVVKRI